MEKTVKFPGRFFKATGWLLFGTPNQKRRVRQECARLAAGIFGDFPISEDHKLWQTDVAFLSDYRMLSPQNPYSLDRKFTLREFARFAKKVPGSMAECGCYQGASAYFLAKERPSIALHLFDSFEGLSTVTDCDRPVSVGPIEWQEGDLRASQEVVRRNLQQFGNVVIHQGWIPEKFYEVDTETFCLVHIDVDLYQPTLDSLKFFYPRMNLGGTIVLDDYGFTSCPGAYKATHDFMADKSEYVVHLPTGQGVIIKGSS